jgi:hypothetical protein
MSIMNATQDCNREALTNSRFFVVLGTPAFLRRMRDADPDLSEQTRLAKLRRKPTLIALIGLDKSEEAELLSYFAGHDVQQVFRTADSQRLSDELSEYMTRAG